MPDEPETTQDRDRAFASAFLALHFDLESSIAKNGIEILCRALEQAREEGRRAGIRQIEPHYDFEAVEERVP